MQLATFLPQWGSVLLRVVIPSLLSSPRGYPILSDGCGARFSHTPFFLLFVPFYPSLLSIPFAVSWLVLTTCHLPPVICYLCTLIHSRSPQTRQFPGLPTVRTTLCYRIRISRSSLPSLFCFLPLILCGIPQTLSTAGIDHTTRIAL